MSNSDKTTQDEAIGELVKAAKENPEVQQAAKNIGNAALTVSKTINNALLPLAAVNFAFDKARAYFAEKFEAEVQAKAASIPQEDLIEPKASIAGPTLQGLAFTHEEPNLKEMYLNLLVTAMDKKISGNAHPAFVEIVKQLTSEEAPLLRDILRNPSVPIAEVRLKTTGRPGYKLLKRHIIDLSDASTGNLVEDVRVPAMLENWVRLGLIEIDYAKHLTAEDAYSWVDRRPEFLRLASELDSAERKVEFAKGLLVRTDFGHQFGKAAGFFEVEVKPA